MKFFLGIDIGTGGARVGIFDDSGNSVSDSGEYYFEVKNMQQGTAYTKKIQIMNMRKKQDIMTLT